MDVRVTITTVTRNAATKLVTLLATTGTTIPFVLVTRTVEVFVLWLSYMDHSVLVSVSVD